SYISRRQVHRLRAVSPRRHEERTTRRAPVFPVGGCAVLGARSWRRLAYAVAPCRDHRLAAGRCGAGDQGVRALVPLDQRVGSGAEPLRWSRHDLRDADDVVHRPSDRCSGQLRDRTLPHRAVAPVAEAPARHGHRVARCSAFDRLRHVGPARLQPDPVAVRPATAAIDVQGRAVPRRALFRTAGGHRAAVSRDHPGHHGHSVHRFGRARRVRSYAADAEGVGLRIGFDDLGSCLEGRSAVHQDRSRRRHHARPRPRARGDDGRHLRDRQLQPAQLAVAVRGCQQHHIGAGQRVRGGCARVAPGVVDLPRAGALLHYFRGPGDLEAPARAIEEARRDGRMRAAAMMVVDDRESVRRRLHARRKLVNGVALTLALGAMAFGLFWLLWILIETVRLGLGGLSLSLFTQMTPPPLAEGGLANAIFGSIVMVTLATLLGTPIGVLAGIYLAEYGRRSWLASTTRFINDILLSAPSIVIGLFIYWIVVARVGSFSGFAGILALALIVIPVVILTTENMLSLIPNALRGAAYALGTPKWRVVMTVTLKAARAGVMTGVLLAFARIAGETAPLLFTALSNQFWTSDLSQPMGSLPVTIFKFAMSPYENWQKLAWAGVFLITLGVLILNILARTFFRNKI